MLCIQEQLNPCWRKKQTKLNYCYRLVAVKINFWFGLLCSSCGNIDADRYMFTQTFAIHYHHPTRHCSLICAGNAVWIMDCLMKNSSSSQLKQILLMIKYTMILYQTKSAWNSAAPFIAVGVVTPKVRPDKKKVELDTAFATVHCSITWQQTAPANKWVHIPVRSLSNLSTIVLKFTCRDEDKILSKSRKYCLIVLRYYEMSQSWICFSWIIFLCPSSTCGSTPTLTLPLVFFKSLFLHVGCI